MARNVHTYDHFCVLARALERVGDRWSLLVVRDLLSGAKRFTDLMNRLGGITPKTLTQRLRELADAGVLAADREPGRREVWYRLTPAGAELGPVLDALGWWGLRHAWRPPHPGEPVHVEHMLRAITQVIDRTAADPAPARWHFRFSDEGDYLVRSDGHRWSMTAAIPQDEPDVTITASTDTWTRFAPEPTARRAAELGVDIHGDVPAVERFHRLVSTFGQTVRSAGPPTGSDPE